LQQRHHRLAYSGIVAAVVLGLGLFALNFPVFLDDFGTGYISDLTQAAAAVGEKNYVSECQSALLLRRVWAGPLVVLGGSVLLAVLVASAATSARESLTSHRDNA
jgi:hypothetical protein